jgi:hypothetical protein
MNSCADAPIDRITSQSSIVSRRSLASRLRDASRVSFPLPRARRARGNHRVVSRPPTCAVGGSAHARSALSNDARNSATRAPSSRDGRASSIASSGVVVAVIFPLCVMI